jgi:hypothetical protein
VPILNLKKTELMLEKVLLSVSWMGAIITGSGICYVLSGTASLTVIIYHLIKIRKELKTKN